MSAKTTNIADVENLVAVLYQQGAVLVSQPILQVDQEDKLKRQALDKALKNAKDQAGAIGLKNWKFLRKITGVAQTPTSTTSTIASGDAASSNQSGQPASVDSFKINTVVTVSYRMW